MKKLLKWSGIVVGGLIGLIVLVGAVLYGIASLRISKNYTVQPAVLTIPGDPAALEHGRHLALIYCAECHGKYLGGTEFFNDPALGRIPGTNLTPGKGGVGSTYKDIDWVRAVRHGVSPSGRPLLVMPSNDLFYLGSRDLADLIGYVKSLQPVNNDFGTTKLKPLAMILLGLGAFGNVLSAEVINHKGPPPPAPEAGVTKSYGDYLVKTTGCRTCHGKELTGGKDPNPKAPPAPDITSSGGVGAWTDEIFISVSRSGKSEFMPWDQLNNMTDDELKAILLYVKSLPGKENKK